MNMDCVDIGTIQAFLDGELKTETAAQVSGHIAACDTCASMLAVAEDESSMVFATLEREIDAMVPTQRIWNRINESIEVTRGNTPFWKKIFAGLLSPSFAMAAGVIVVAGVFAAFYGSYMEQAGDKAKTQEIASLDTNKPPDNAINVLPVVAGKEPRDDNSAKPAQIQVSTPRKAEFVKAKAYAQKTSSNITIQPAAYLPGEESYVKTIKTLSGTVEQQKNSVLRPSQQVAYERDLAVVDGSIKRMREAVRKNPKNEAAKQVLYASYQNKIDLLNSVAQKEELVASLK